MLNLAIGFALGVAFMVALILFVNHGPGEKVWHYDED
jgi:hypothetical protein